MYRKISDISSGIKIILPYALSVVPMALVWVVQKNQQDGAVLLMWEVLLAFSAYAAWEDYSEKIVRNRLVLAMLGIWVLVLVPQMFVRTEVAVFLLFSGGIGLLLSGTLFLLLYVVSRKGLGGGDVKFMAVSGLYLGAEATLPAMLIGSLLTGATGLILILLKRIGKRDTMPLVPFLYAGMIVAMLTRGGMT